MKNKILRLVAKITTFATIMSSVMTFSPASAGTPSNIKDTLSRNQISATAVTHNLTGTIPTDTWGSGETLIFTYANFTAFTAVTPTTCTITTGTLTSCLTSGANVLTLLCATGPCGGTLTVTGANWTSTNPSSAGSNTVSISGTGGVTGSFALASVDSDQVSVTASVDPSITFDLDTAVTNTETAQPYSVPLGTLTTGAVNRSDDATINGIWVDISTNAGGGAIVTVLSLNGANGLVSTSTPADNINSTSSTMAAGTENYGLCVSTGGLGAPTQTTGGPLISVAPFNGATCTTGSANVVGALTTSPQNVLSTSTDPIAGGRAQIRVNAAISGVTAAHTDYTDTLTFVATATF